MRKGPGSALAVLDFSGVLSPGAAAFGERQNLQRALSDSGLTALGLDLAAFWSEIINPAWPEGSTTAQGYRNLLGEGLLRLAAARGKYPALEAVFAAADRFTAAYLRSSAIEPLWAPILQRLLRQQTVVVATDHYAEATSHIVKQLAALRLSAVPALEPRSGCILVANSADLGALKESVSFWEALHRHGIAAAPAVVLLVDDFGGNEQADDSYAAPEKYAARKNRTVAAIENCWNAPVKVYPFVCRQGDTFPALVSAARDFLLP